MRENRIHISNKSLVAIKASLLVAVLIGLVVFVVSVIPVFANHSSDSNVITPGYEACNVLNTYTLTVTQTGGPDPIYSVRIYNRSIGNPFPDQRGFSCGAAPTGWTYKGFFIIGDESYCEYETTRDPTNTYTIANGEHENFTFSINITKESVHPFRVSTIDTQLPVGYHYFSFPNITVDCTPPLTTKSFIGPQKKDGDVEWIDGITLVNLTAIDQIPHPSGVAETWYKNILFEGGACGLEVANCVPVDPNLPCLDKGFCDSLVDAYDMYPGDFVPYIEPFPKDGESCHVLWYYSVDNVGNVEDMKVNCFFVDKTPPTPEKIIGDPNVPCRCGECDEFDYWVMDHVTPITLNCTDEGPHPSEGEEVCYNVSLDGLDITDQYCTLEDLELIEQPGYEGEWCCVPAPEEIVFVEDSLHDLEFFCRDAVDKKSAIDIEWFRVDSLPPIIEKTMIGEDHLGDCPPEDELDECYVRDYGNNGVRIDVKDNDTYDCAVGDVICEKYLLWITTEQECIDAGKEYLGDVFVFASSIQSIENLINNNDEEGFCLLMNDTFSDYQEIIFTEDSYHLLLIGCEDALGNLNVDVEIFLVDSEPPETNKTFGEPFVEGWFPKECMVRVEGEPEPQIKPCTWAEWINSSTPITFEAEDGKVGVDKIWYKNILYSGDPAYNPCEYPEYCMPFRVDYPKECIDEVQYNCTEIEGHTPYTEDWYNCVEQEAFAHCCGGWDWKLYKDEPIYKEEESCHQLYYFSVDHLGNVEPVNVNCFFVDNTSPVVDKVIGYPKVEGDPNYISGKTPINLTCWDDEPHPVDHVSLWYRYRVSDDCVYWGDWTDWTDPIPVPNGDNSYKVVKTIYFPEDSCHELEYYCVDGLGNKGPVHSEIDIVDNQPPEITKTVVGPQIDCPDIDPVIEECYKWDCLMHNDEMDHKDFEATIRYGQNNPGTGGWELAIKNPDAGEEEYGHFGWTSGNYVPFTFSYDAATGLVTLEVGSGGSKQTLTYQYNDGMAFEYIAIVAKGQESGNRDTHVRNIDINGVSVPDVLADNDYDGVRVFLSYPDLQSGFTMTGEVALSWDTPPGGSGSEIPGFQIFAMNTYKDCYQIDGVTETYIDVVDPEPHPVGLEECYWWYYLKNETGKYRFPSSGVYWSFPITFPEESRHELHIKCKDLLENEVEDIEVFIVDKTPPKIDKDYGCPSYSEEICVEWGEDDFCVKKGGYCPKPCVKREIVEWISGDTKIKISVEDDGPHKSGIKETKYRYHIVDDDYCWGILDCEDATTDEDWITMSDPTYEEFYITNDSCHLIEIFSKDNVDKNTTHKQCVFVDNTGPEPVKTVGEPKDEWHPGEPGEPESYFYPWIDEYCWNETKGEEMIECWEATTLTPIIMDCDDSWNGQDPHPVGEKKICFKVEMDGEDVTREYCRKYGGNYHKKEGYCCRWLGPMLATDVIENDVEFFGYHDKCDEVQEIECYKGRKIFYFLEETEHNLKYYCIDKLWNKGPVDEEKFKIEGNKFEIPLFKKWNLISVPFVLLDDNPETVFSKIFFDGELVENISDYIDSVWTYDPDNGICANDWCVWKPGLGGTLDDVKPGWGYWVLVTDKPEEECRRRPKCFWYKDNEEPLWMVIGGSLFSPAVTPPSRDLQKGWNLIGYYGINWEEYDWGDFDFMCGDKYRWPDKWLYGDKVYCALNSLIDTQEGFPRWSSLWSYINCGNHNTNWMGLNACINPSPFVAQDRMYAGRGYWLELDVPDIYAPATNCIWNSDFECVWTGGGM